MTSPSRDAAAGRQLSADDGATADAAVIKVTADALLVLAGPSGAGKSTWAAEWFRPSQIVSSDELRAVVGEHEHDLRASADSFDVLDLIIERRLRRGLLTVVDTLGMDVERHEQWLAVAAEYGRPSHLITFDDEPKHYRKRNKARPAAVPPKVLTAQIERWTELRPDLGNGFANVHQPGPAIVVPSALAGPVSDSAEASLTFGLQISAFDWEGGNETIGAELARIAGEAERAGFSSIWLMDHMIQIPQVGREWDPMLEPYTALGFLAAHTERMTLGTMVSCVTYRNVWQLAKIVATLDVLSGGRARCGIGLGWFEREHRAYGYPFPSVSERYELLEDALELLPLMWGPGGPAFSGRRLSSPETICYPRPIQSRIPILIGGSGGRRTLPLVARYGDACNLFGEPEVIRAKLEVLDRCCADAGRDRAEIEVTQLSAILSAPDAGSLRDRVDHLRPGGASPEAFIERSMAATAEHHLERFTALADAGVQTAIVSLADVGVPGAVSDFAPVIEALSA